MRESWGWQEWMCWDKNSREKKVIWYLGLNKKGGKTKGREKKMDISKVKCVGRVLSCWFWQSGITFLQFCEGVTDKSKDKARLITEKMEICFSHHGCHGLEAPLWSSFISYLGPVCLYIYLPPFTGQNIHVVPYYWGNFMNMASANLLLQHVMSKQLSKLNIEHCPVELLLKPLSFPGWVIAQIVTGCSPVINIFVYLG